jgi:hypothetical protein
MSNLSWEDLAKLLIVLFVILGIVGTTVHDQQMMAFGYGVAVAIGFLTSLGKF